MSIATVPTTDCKKGWVSFEQFQEFVKDSFINGSGIDPELFDACVEFHREVEHAEYDGDAETPIHDLLDWDYKRYTNKDQTLYAAFLKNEDGSVWQAVVSAWDELKRRPYMYVAPKKDSSEATGDRVFLPPVPQSIRAKIAQCYNLEVPNEGSFWKWVETAKIVRMLTEGGKKTLCGLSNGYLTLGLYGCLCGVTTKDNQDVKLLQPRLNEGLQRFTKFPAWLIAFDEDVKETAQKAVASGTKRLRNALKIENCRVESVRWNPDDGKGLDDLVVNSGVEDFDYTYREAIEKLERAFLSASATKPANQDQGIQSTLNQSAFNRFFAEERWICVNDVLYQWDVNYYREVKDTSIKARIAEFCNTWVETDKYGVRRYVGAKSGVVEEVLKWAKCCLCVDPESVNPPGINCTNGIARINWIISKEPIPVLIPHSPDEYYTYPPLVKYDPDADTSDCDRLLECLDPAQQEVLMRNLGAAFDLEQVRKRRGREVRLLLCCGLGSNGKDALREVVSTIFGNQGITSVSLADFSAYDDGRKFALAPLVSSRVNWASENPMTERLDKIQSLKLFATGNNLHAERKGKDHIEFKPLGVGLFNLNDVPSLQGTLEATKTRLAALRFRKTYKTNPDPSNPNEMLADPRFAYDTEFIQQCVAPAFLNRMIKGLQDLISEGIDYECTEDEFLAMQKENNHLFQFFEDAGLRYCADGSVTAKDIWVRLEEWYQATGTLTYNENGKPEWADQARPSDRNIKAINQVLPRISALFPNAQKVTTYDAVSKNRIQILKGIAFVNDNTRTIIENTRTNPVATPVPKTTEYQDSRTTRTNFPNVWEEEKNNFSQPKEQDSPETGTGGTEPLQNKESCYGSATGGGTGKPETGTGKPETGTGGTNTQDTKEFDPSAIARLIFEYLQSENAGLLLDALVKKLDEVQKEAVRKELSPEVKGRVREELKKFSARKQSSTNSNQESPLPTHETPAPEKSLLQIQDEGTSPSEFVGHLVTVKGLGGRIKFQGEVTGFDELNCNLTVKLPDGSIRLAALRETWLLETSQ